MHARLYGPILVIAVTLSGLLPVGAQQRPASTAVPQRFTAAAISGGGPRSNPVAQNVEITINRWSTAAERQRLSSAMAKGQDALLDTLKELRSVGTIKTPGNLAYDLRYAHQVALEDGGRRIFLATDRPITTWEAINRPRTIDYPFTFMHLRMNGDGRGEGTLSLATRVIVDDDENLVEFERYTANPIQLNEIRLQP